MRIGRNLFIDEDELTFAYVRGSGPGGQNVNKVATAAQLRFDVRSNTSLPAEVKARLLRLAGSKATDDGVLIIEARRFRSQIQNRGDALARFIHLVTKAEEKPRPRKKTKPSKGSVEKRLQVKKRRGALKRSRRGLGDE